MSDRRAIMKHVVIFVVEVCCPQDHFLESFNDGRMNVWASRLAGELDFWYNPRDAKVYSHRHESIYEYCTSHMIERLSVSLGELDLWYNPRDAKGLLTNPSMNMSTLHNSIQTCLVLEAFNSGPDERRSF